MFEQKIVTLKNKNFKKSLLLSPVCQKSVRNNTFRKKVACSRFFFLSQKRKMWIAIFALAKCRSEEKFAKVGAKKLKSLIDTIFSSCLFIHVAKRLHLFHANLKEFKVKKLFGNFKSIILYTKFCPNAQNVLLNNLLLKISKAKSERLRSWQKCEQQQTQLFFLPNFHRLFFFFVSSLRAFTY